MEVMFELQMLASLEGFSVSARLSCKHITKLSVRVPSLNLAYRFRLLEVLQASGFWRFLITYLDHRVSALLITLIVCEMHQFQA